MITHGGQIALDRAGGVHGTFGCAGGLWNTSNVLETVYSSHRFQLRMTLDEYLTRIALLEEQLRASGLANVEEILEELGLRVGRPLVEGEKREVTRTPKVRNHALRIQNTPNLANRFK